nr:MAG: hypothetical protein [Botourmiaviridae sp.]
MLGADDKSLGLCEPLKGVRSKRCSCRVNARRTKEVIENAFKILRVRFGLPAGELPYLEPSRLSIYLLSLLSSSPSSSRKIRLPRCQKGFDSEGFPILTRLGRLERWRLASAVASVKRALPNDVCEAHPPPSRLTEWAERQCSEVERTSPLEYRQFARRVAAEVFQPGWDKSYRSFCRSFVPRASARAEKLPCGFSWKASDWWADHSSREEYLASTILGKPFKYDHPSRYKEIPTAGKVRPMIIPSASIDLLGPLHKSMYEHMSTLPWLLKGAPSVDKLRQVLDERWKTSVDLANATDGLTLDICDIVLDVCQSSCKYVPAEVWSRARRSLRPLLTADGDFYRVSNGQMMGQYLSFPLLCFQSYLAARWATRGVSAKIRINGDDCLIGSPSPDIVNRYPCHLQINYDKTAVRERVAEINSTQFILWGGKWKEVVTARRLGGVHSHLSGLVHMAQSCLGGGDKWVTAFVRTRIGRRSRVSPVDLGLPSTNREVFWRHQGMPYFRAVPRFTVDNDDRLEKMTEKPTEDEVEELRTLLFNEGRYVPDRQIDVKIKDLPYRPNGSLLKRIFVPNAFAKHRRVCRLERKTKENVYFRVRKDPVFEEPSAHVLSAWEVRRHDWVDAYFSCIREYTNKKIREHKERTEGFYILGGRST